MIDLVAWVRGLFACRHRRTYRERRPLVVGLVGPAPGTTVLEVLHWVCEDCGFARPCVDRTLEEHRKAVKARPLAPRASRTAAQTGHNALYDTFKAALVDGPPPLVNALEAPERENEPRQDDDQPPTRRVPPWAPYPDEGEK